MMGMLKALLGNGPVNTFQHTWPTILGSSENATIETFFVAKQQPARQCTG
jgi:hypothetical protein